MRTFAKIFAPHAPVVTAVGWDGRRFLQLGRASWRIDQVSGSTQLVYRNLEQARDYPLGAVDPGSSAADLLEMFADQYESHTPGDFVVWGDRLFVLTLDPGQA